MSLFKVSNDGVGSVLVSQQILFITMIISSSAFEYDSYACISVRSFVRQAGSCSSK